MPLRMLLLKVSRKLGVLMISFMVRDGQLKSSSTESGPRGTWLSHEYSTDYREHTMLHTPMGN